MKVGSRQQQGRDGATPKTICPLCGNEYLETFWGYKNRKFQKKGKYCPSEGCSYSKKDLN
jgi:hypothetical protein